MDLKEEYKKEDSEEKNNNNNNNTPSPKCCSDCHTTRTPLWRGGPAGPKSLCNACGIKYNKKRRQVLGLETARKKKRSSGGVVSNSGSSSEEVREILKMRFMALGNEMVFQRLRMLMRKLREEELAALLLMTLSFGSVY